MTRFVFPYLDSLAVVTDALSISWDKIVSYAFPPTVLIPKVLEKVVQSRMVLVLVAPFWPAQPWSIDRSTTVNSSKQKTLTTTAIGSLPQQARGVCTSFVEAISIYYPVIPVSLAQVL